MLGPHIFGECLVTFLNSAINCRQSVRCWALALEAMYSSTLASVGLVLFSATLSSFAADAAPVAPARVDHLVAAGAVKTLEKVCCGVAAVSVVTVVALRYNKEP